MYDPASADSSRREPPSGTVDSEVTSVETWQTTADGGHFRTLLVGVRRGEHQLVGESGRAEAVLADAQEISDLLRAGYVRRIQLAGDQTGVLAMLDRDAQAESVTITFAQPSPELDDAVPRRRVGPRGRISRIRDAQADQKPRAARRRRGALGGAPCRRHFVAARLDGAYLAELVRALDADSTLRAVRLELAATRIDRGFELRAGRLVIVFLAHRLYSLAADADRRLCVIVPD